MTNWIRPMLIAAVLIDVAYWSVWFSHRDWLASEHSQAYYDFENAFPLADLWLGVACLLAFVALRRNGSTALLWLLCAGASALYLGCMDLLYDVEHGIFGKGAGGLIEGAIVALTWIFGVAVLRWAWTNRQSLLN